MSQQTYQGWTNYETWAVALWLDNEESSYNYWTEAAEAAWSESEFGGNRFIRDREGRALAILSDRLKAELDDDAEIPELRGFYADLLNAALGEVDWHSLAEHYLSNVDKDEVADEQ